MPNEFGVIICPNPECRRTIKEPILLSDLSTTPSEQYYACPHCFIKLDEEDENKEDITQESTSGPSLHPVLEKVLDVISAQSQKEEEEKEEPPVRSPKKEEKGPSRCAGYFGYLATRPENAPIPKECLICPKVLDCAMKISDS